MPVAGKYLENIFNRFTDHNAALFHWFWNLQWHKGIIVGVDLL